MQTETDALPGEIPVAEYEYDHSVTYTSTTKHWVLYSLDGLEAAWESDDGDENKARERGVYPEDIYEFAAGDDSIVFKSKSEVSQTLSKMARNGVPWKDESRPVNRRCEASEWDGADVKFRYRLNDFGRKVLLDLGVPDKLPNRRDFDEDDRALGVKPGHKPGWWRETPEYEHYDNEWDITENDWTKLADRVFVKDDGSEGLINDRGYTAIGVQVAEAFPDVTFVLTCGPYRQHDLMYAIRDPWRKVVQIDIYSPMSFHRDTNEITRNIERLVKDLHKGLRSVDDEYGSDAYAD